MHLKPPDPTHCMSDRKNAKKRKKSAGGRGGGKGVGGRRRGGEEEGREAVQQDRPLNRLFLVFLVTWTI